MFLACSRGSEDKRAATPLAAAAVDSGPAPKPSFSSAGADISWLVGTWERQSAPKEWLLFNPPKQIAVISGSPPAVNARGEFVPNGRSISLFFRGTGGSNIERVFEASPDYSELRETATPPATYRRGAPP
jgi:hypothetical protein